MREQLGKLLEHIGEKEIATWHIGGFPIPFHPTTVILSGIAALIVLVIALFLRRALSQPVEERPNRTQATLDIVLDLLDSQLMSSFSSRSFGLHMFPFIATLFLYVLASNWLSLLPGLEAPTTDPNVTLGLALMVLVLVQYYGIRARGLRAYGKSFFSPWWLSPFTILSDVIARPLSHGFRLFGNVFGEMVLVTIVMAKLDPFVVPIALRAIFGIGFGLIQAFVFAILAVAYINLATEHH